MKRLYECLLDVVEELGLADQVECLRCGATQFVWMLCSACDGCRDCCTTHQEAS